MSEIGKAAPVFVHCTKAAPVLAGRRRRREGRGGKKQRRKAERPLTRSKIRIKGSVSTNYFKHYCEILLWLGTFRASTGTWSLNRGRWGWDSHRKPETDTVEIMHIFLSRHLTWRRLARRKCCLPTPGTVRSVQFLLEPRWAELSRAKPSRSQLSSALRCLVSAQRRPHCGQRDKGDLPLLPKTTSIAGTDNARTNAAHICAHQEGLVGKRPHASTGHRQCTAERTCRYIQVM